MDQLVNHAAKLRYMSGGQTNVPITVRTASGAGFGFGGQHSDMLESWLCHVPGLKVVIPSTAADAKGLLLSCIFDDDPCVFVEMTFHYFSPKAASHVPEGDHRVPLGSARIARPGSDATIVTYGRQVHESLDVADQLAGEGIDVEVIDLRTLVPLDLDAVLSSVARTRRAVVVHEAVRRGGFGAELSATITEHLWGELAGPVRRVGASSSPVPYAPELEQAMQVQQADIAAAVRDAVGEGPGAAS
jgi:pyruvate dehydrogenase E1 component beta subunit